MYPATSRTARETAMKLRYCTECAAPLQQRDSTEYVCAKGHEYWNEPHASACVAVLRDDEVLLARRRIEPRKGTYVLPGGFVDFDETPYEAARREMREETGLECTELDLLEVHTIRYRENEASLSVVFHARRWYGTPEAGDDAAALVWRPVGFVESDEFAWHIPGLADKLRALLG
jgi:8-oxo-dGTP diphosphatase